MSYSIPQCVEGVGDERMSSPEQPPEFLTRAEIPEFLGRHGFPIGRSTIDKLSMPSRGDNAGPQPAGIWGNRHLYRPGQVLRWARNRFRSIETT
jgi:hypothetical protein